MPAVFDVRSLEDCEALTRELIREHGRLDVLVNAARVSLPRSEVHDLNIQEWHNVIAVNQTGVMLEMHSTIATMLGRGLLAIVNISLI